MKKSKKRGPKPLSPYPAEVEKYIKDTYSKLSEKDRRAYAAIEALKLPRGGNTYIMGLLGCSKKTLLRGIYELENPDTELQNRIRKKGAGRKSSIETIEILMKCFSKLLMIISLETLWMKKYVGPI
jgi:ABC-type lipoprotein export system ATPase subunit